MRGTIRVLFVVMVLLGLGIVAANVSSINAVYGEHDQAGLIKSLSVAATDQLLMGPMIAAGAVVVVGLLGLVLVSVLWRPKAVEEGSATEEESVPEE